MEFTDLEKLIKGRRSIHSWQDKKVPEELLLQALKLATWAPNAGNQQNWYFYVIVNQDTITAIADAVQAIADQIASWPEATKFGDDAARMLERASIFRNAPAAIAVASTRYHSSIDQILTAREKIDPKAGQIREWRNIANSRIQSTSSSIAYLLLILHQIGLGALWMTGPMQAKGEIEKILKVPPEIDIVAFIPVGYSAESPAPKGRRPIEEVCEIIR